MNELENERKQKHGSGMGLLFASFFMFSESPVLQGWKRKKSRPETVPKAKGRVALQERRESVFPFLSLGLSFNQSGRVRKMYK